MPIALIVIIMFMEVLHPVTFTCINMMEKFPCSTADQAILIAVFWKWQPYTYSQMDNPGPTLLLVLVIIYLLEEIVALLLMCDCCGECICLCYGVIIQQQQQNLG